LNSKSIIVIPLETLATLQNNSKPQYRLELNILDPIYTWHT